ncbi:MAG: GNAT family N-acetyltransferase [Flavobacteriaceae bacterium]|tara:strand:- start:3876 stop:4169 length:294 start_codon:yes stop_codon:yes gene_type:complete
MESYTLHNNDFLRQFEVKVKGKLARIEYAEQERKIFLTKISIPENIQDPNFKNWFIKKVLDYVENKNIKVVPTSPEIAIFLRKNKNYKKLLPVGIKL